MICRVRASGPMAAPHTFDEWAYPISLMRAAVTTSGLIAISLPNRGSDLQVRRRDEKRYLQCFRLDVLDARSAAHIGARVFGER